MCGIESGGAVRERTAWKSASLCAWRRDNCNSCNWVTKSEDDNISQAYCGFTLLHEKKKKHVQVIIHTKIMLKNDHVIFPQYNSQSEILFKMYYLYIRLVFLVLHLIWCKHFLTRSKNDIFFTQFIIGFFIWFLEWNVQFYFYHAV